MGIDHEEKHHVSSKMIKYGGHFVNLLGQMLQTADHINTQKIKNTWPEYWQDYKEMKK